MINFKKYGDGKYRARDNENKIQFTTSIPPNEVRGWEDSGLETKDGYTVLVPQPETVSVNIDEVKVHKQSDDNDVVDVKYNWAE